jgi:predicted methyltransferase
MNPSRAAALVRLAAAADGETVLDPCGGIGLLAIEAAAFAAVAAISLDIDPAACDAASANVTAASAGILRGQVEVRCGDALASGLPGNSVDLAVADLPFGVLHPRLDVGALLRELWRVLRPGGRALLVHHPPLS